MNAREQEGIIIRFGNNLYTWLTVVVAVGSLVGAVFFGGTAIGANRRILDLPEELAKARASLEAKIESSENKTQGSFKDLNTSIESIKDRLKTLEFNVSGANGLLERFGQLSGRLEANIEADVVQAQRIRELEILLNQVERPRKP